MKLLVFPQSLERRRAPEALGPSAARVVQRVDTRRRPGQAERGRGQVRASNFSGDSYTGRNGFVFERPDGTKLLAYSTAEGKVKVQTGVEPSELDAAFGL